MVASFSPAVRSGVYRHIRGVTAKPFERFASRSREDAYMKILRWIIIPFLCVHFTLAMISGYRAIVQIFRLELRVPDSQVAGGSRVGLYVKTSARVEAIAILELRQGARAETLGIQCMPRNWDAAYDPRPRHDSIFTVLGADVLGRFAPGPATLRATAIGSMQWLRTPPPTVREASVTIVASDLAVGPSRTLVARRERC
jgi:hypothetical protein